MAQGAKMEKSTEIRHLTPSLAKNLERILEEQQSWKLLMAIVPKTLKKDIYECQIEPSSNSNKYTFDHMKLVENASKKDTRSASEIFLYEWSTSGRIRPTLGHLLFLLKKAELYRAAEFVSSKILLLNAPLDRPLDGPAAKIDLLDMESTVIDTGITIENNLNKGTDKRFVATDSTADINSGALPMLLNQTNFGLKNAHESGPDLPSSIMDESTVSDLSSDLTPDFDQLRVGNKLSPTKSEELSDMIKFSSNEITSNGALESSEGDNIPVMILNFDKK